MKIALIYIFFLLPNFLLAQKTDSTFIRTDSSSFNNTIDSVSVSDTLKSKKKTWDINAIINSSASDSIIFKVKEKKMELYGNSEIKYKQTNLKSANIYVDFQTNKIAAEGVPDTADQTGEKLMGTPVLQEGNESYEGTNLTYNFKTQQGFISLARTKSEGTSYGGAKVKKMDKETYFVEDGIYTTCTDSIPHYNFFAKEMKVILKEQIIARWIWLFVGGVPFPIPLPFAAFPTQSGRRSGFIAPAYGESADKGWYLSHLGYFLAISDYMDLNATLDYFFKGGFNVNSRFRYAKRYSLNGNIEGGYSNLHTGEIDDPDYNQNRNWRFSLSHNQVIDPTTRLDAYITFTSGKQFYNNNYVDYDNLLAQDIVSNATLFKSWEESGNSLSLNYSRNQNLQTGDINETLPNLTFTVNQSYPFKRKGRVDAADQKWYELIGYSYSGQFLNRRNKTGGDLKIRGGIQHSIGIGASPKVGYISISPRISYIEKWYNKRIEKFIGPIPIYDSNKVIKEYKNDVITKDINEINMVRSFDFSISASTRLFGIVQPNILGIEALRHTITPSISYNYRPDFSKSSWGYYGSYYDTAGRLIRYDTFGEEVFGGAGSGEQQSINFSVGNVFEMKTIKDPTDTTSEAKKIRLLNLDASVGYNFVKDSLKLSNLSLRTSTQVSEFLNFSGDASFSFYDYVNDEKRGPVQINKYLISENKGLMKLTNFSFSVSFSLSGEKLKSKESKQLKDKNEQEEDQAVFQKNKNATIYHDESPDFEIPWDVSLNYNYRFDKINHDKSSNISVNLNTNLTKTWKLSLSTYYDIFTQKFQAPAINIYKDLHCWEMKITWNPLGAYRGYRFEIRLKAPQLQDLKIERRRGQFQGVGY